MKAKYPKEAFVFEVHYPGNSFWEHRIAEMFLPVWHDGWWDGGFPYTAVIPTGPKTTARALVGWDNVKPLTPAARDMLAIAKARR